MYIGRTVVYRRKQKRKKIKKQEAALFTQFYVLLKMRKSCPIIKEGAHVKSPFFLILLLAAWLHTISSHCPNDLYMPVSIGRRPFTVIIQSIRPEMTTTGIDNSIGPVISLYHIHRIGANK